MIKTKDESSQKSIDTHNILTLDEVASQLRIHRTTVTRYAMSGELKSYKLGSRRLFKASDVKMFFDNQVAKECVSALEV